MDTPIWRDRQAWRNDGFCFSTTSDDALKLYDHIVHDFFTGKAADERFGISSLIEQLEIADASFILLKVIKYVLASDSSVLAGIQLSMDNGALTDFERFHCQAVIAYSKDDDIEAAQILASTLFEYPCDLLTLKMCYNLHLKLGNSSMLRDVISRVLPFFQKSSPYYGYLLSRLAFGLEETNFLEAAEETVRKGLSMVPDDYWGLHTIAHVFESTCKFQEGVSYLEKTESVWSRQGLSCHMYWHLCLFYIELEKYDKAIAVFDKKMTPLIISQQDSFPLGDGVQLLQRLEFNNIHVGGDRWEAMLGVSKQQSVSPTDAYFLPFIYLPYVKSTKRQENDEALLFCKQLEKYVLHKTHNACVAKDVVVPLVEAFKAHSSQQYNKVADIVYQLKDTIIRLGYSNAQRDFYNLLLLDSCVRSNDSKYHRIGKCLLNERTYLKKDSPMTKRMVETIGKN